MITIRPIDEELKLLHKPVAISVTESDGDSALDGFRVAHSGSVMIPSGQTKPMIMQRRNSTSSTISTSYSSVNSHPAGMGTLSHHEQNHQYNQQYQQQYQQQHFSTQGCVHPSSLPRFPTAPLPRSMPSSLPNSLPQYGYHHTLPPPPPALTGIPPVGMSPMGMSPMGMSPMGYSSSPMGYSSSPMTNQQPQQQQQHPNYAYPPQYLYPSNRY